jgi:hypothetical protein
LFFDAIATNEVVLAARAQADDLLRYTDFDDPAPVDEADVSTATGDHHRIGLQ